MKRIFRTLVAMMAMAACLCSFAQENQVNRIPTVGIDNSQVRYSEYESSVWFAVEAGGGYSCHFKGHNMGMAEADLTVGYRFNQYFKPGIGIGARYYINPGALRLSNIKWGFPLYVAVRGNIINGDYRSIVPYYEMAVGGTIRDGFMIRPSIGLHIGNPRRAFTLALSYLGQDVKVDSDRATKTMKFNNFVAVRLGYEF